AGQSSWVGGPLQKVQVGLVHEALVGRCRSTDKLNLYNQPSPAPRQIEEVAGAVYLEIDGRRQVAGKPGHEIAALRIELANPGTHEIGEEIIPCIFGGELLGRWIVKSATGDRESLGGSGTVQIGENRGLETGIVRRAFGIGPAVIAAFDALVDFFPGHLADVIDEHLLGAWLKGKGERIAQAQGEDFASGACHSNKGVVARNRAVGIDAQHFAQESGKSL